MLFNPSRKKGQHLVRCFAIRS